MNGDLIDACDSKSYNYQYLGLVIPCPQFSEVHPDTEILKSCIPADVLDMTSETARYTEIFLHNTGIL